MAKIVPTDQPGRFQLVEADGTVVGYGHLEVPYVPPTPAQAILSDVQFILEPRSEDAANEQMMIQAHGGV